MTVWPWRSSSAAQHSPNDLAGAERDVWRKCCNSDDSIPSIEVSSVMDSQRGLPVYKLRIPMHSADMRHQDADAQPTALLLGFQEQDFAGHEYPQDPGTRSRSHKRAKPKQILFVR